MVESNDSDKAQVGWPEYIGLGWLINQERMEADLKHLWEYSLPKVRASEEQVIQAEKQLGFRLPESYRSFLLAANGWPNFTQNVTIFSTQDLVGGPLYDSARIPLNLPECVAAMAMDGVIAEEHFPVAASELEDTVFLMGKPGTTSEGKVVWYADGQVIDRYDNFHDFYMAMLEYNKSDARELRQENGLPPRLMPGEKGYRPPRFEDDEPHANAQAPEA
ncbi:SMI1/KNR4 family protein [Actinomyces sp. Z5]|uniref:SMI1/KNR4 family protein n=1 Tax=Actinomyces sp. Z5 TaxID=2250216 RepID=UPI000DCB26D1|nr:SMI1/KNR4 family protein [Actinomyces sp. Z5]RAX19367.1 SMI1/KNR4 family protein [Actinomyces sp. Z5]